MIFATYFFGENLQEIDIFVKSHYIPQYKYLSYA